MLSYHLKNMCVPHPRMETCVASLEGGLPALHQVWRNQTVESALWGRSQTKPHGYSRRVYRYGSSPNTTSSNGQDWLYRRKMRQPVLTVLGAWGAEHIITLDSITHNNICFETSQHHSLSRKNGSSFPQRAELQMFLTDAMVCSF